MCSMRSYRCCGQSVYSRLAGYEDTNDAARLARDPAMQAVVGRRALEKQAASTNTLSRFETEVLVTEENLRGLERLNAAWVDRAMTRTRYQRVILDMDSSESPVYGEQEGTAYNGHFQSVCYHPLFLFNHFGDCEGALLRSGNVHSADRWQEVLAPVVERYQRKGYVCSSGATPPLPNRRFTSIWSSEALDTPFVCQPTRSWNRR